MTNKRIPDKIMFTGIVEEVGRVSKVISSPVFELGVEASKVTETLNISDSICTNGVCLTVTATEGKNFEVQIMPHTLKKTNLTLLKPGDKVNLERALLPTSSLSGHFVTGDVDGMVRVERIEREVAQWTFALKPSVELRKYIVPRGRIALEGVSLTVAKKEDEAFKVCLIPHTLKSTTLGHCKQGDLLNLEVDILAKYVDEILTLKQNRRTGVTFNLLQQAGY